MTTRENGILWARTLHQNRFKGHEKKAAYQSERQPCIQSLESRSETAGISSNPCGNRPEGLTSFAFYVIIRLRDISNVPFIVRYGVGTLKSQLARAGFFFFDTISAELL